MVTPTTAIGVTMSKTVKSILIDPANHTITMIEREQTLRAIYKSLSSETVKVGSIDAVRLPNGDAIYVDDEGALFEGNPTWCFRYAPHVKLAGRGMVTGADAEGDDIAPRITVEELQRDIVFLDMVTTGEFGPSSEQTNADGSFVLRMGDAVLKDKDG